MAFVPLSSLLFLLFFFFVLLIVVVVILVLLLRLDVIIVFLVVDFVVFCLLLFLLLFFVFLFSFCLLLLFSSCCECKSCTLDYQCLLLGDTSCDNQLLLFWWDWFWRFSSRRNQRLYLVKPCHTIKSLKLTCLAKGLAVTFQVKTQVRHRKDTAIFTVFSDTAKTQEWFLRHAGIIFTQLLIFSSRNRIFQCAGTTPEGSVFFRLTLRSIFQCTKDLYWIRYQSWIHER